MTRLLYIGLLGLLLSSTSLADGLLVSSSTGYPTAVMRNRMTSVTVDISGLVAETVVYQEFVNEWSRSTDAVWVFPLPADARATAFFYWRHDTLFQAVLRVQEQSTTPGTGEGGVPAMINNYIGANGLKIELKGIEPWTVQRIELHYISVCDYSFGEGTYRYPLGSGDFVRHPLDLFEFRLRIDGKAAISEHRCSLGADAVTEQEAPGTLALLARKSKCYVNADVEFAWTSRSDTLGVDFFSSKTDSTDGYYSLLIRPPDLPRNEDVINKRVIFCIETSSLMYGLALSQTKTAVIEALGQLGEHDLFNVLSFNTTSRAAFTFPMPVTAEHIAIAQAFVSALTPSGGTQLGGALSACFTQMPKDGLHNIVVGVTSGRSPGDPRTVAQQNTPGASVIMIGVGTGVDRSRLEMIAEYNSGFARFFAADDAMAPGMARVFRSLRQPLIRDVGLEYPDINVHAVRPDPVPPLFAGMHSLTAGRYLNPGPTSMSLFGQGAETFRSFTFRLDFAGATGARSIAEKLWAKLMIDGMERQIDVFGVRPSLKDSLIAISLASGIRCRYTAYIADYQEVIAGVGDEGAEPPVPGEASCIVDNYPNPFNPATSIRVFIHAADAGKGALTLCIYDMLGRLVRVIDLSRLPAGTHVIAFDGRDSSGRPLPSGSYTLVLTGARVLSARGIVLMK